MSPRGYNGRRTYGERAKLCAEAAGMVLKHASTKAGPIAVVNGRGKLTILEDSDADLLLIARMLLLSSIAARKCVFGGFSFRRRPSNRGSHD